MTTVENQIEQMWDNPADRRERWLGFLGKLGYEVGGVALVFLVVFSPFYAVVLLTAGVSTATVVGPSIPVVVLFRWVADKAFCNVICR